jgi:UDP-N-acetylmuramoyl-L-alanyl-D-glutamate--2,6-diaminopimelate ligase
MDLAALVHDLKATPTEAGGGTLPMPIGERGAIDIRGVTDDSRRVRPGWLFVAKAGLTQDGAAFVRDAVRAGAVAVLADRPIDGAGVPVIVASASPGLAKVAAIIAERFHGEPSKSLALVGITGTNGKTTTAHLTQQILNDVGVKAGLIGTVVVDDGRVRESALWTTPPSHVLSETFARMRAHGCLVAAMEVSSHALHQDRVAALSYRVGVFTNLTGDHLDYHGSMEAYAQAKAKLFEMLPADGTAIVNAMDPWAQVMIERTRASVWRCRVINSPQDGDGDRDGGDGDVYGGSRGAPGSISSGVRGGAIDCTARLLASDQRGMQVRVHGPWGEFEATLPLVGSFNLMNALQAAAAAWATGLVPSTARLQDALERAMPPPGRLERVGPAGMPFLVLIDYAHTDDALAKALASVRPLVTPGAKLHVVFGCGGDRDRTKRPRMGRVAQHDADVVWITSDNPRSEEPRAIIEEILKGLEHPAPVAASRAMVHVEPDRSRAIEGAIESLRAGDVLLIAGKGHEQGQIVSDGQGGLRTVPFSDQIVASEAVSNRSSTMAEPRSRSITGEVQHLGMGDRR